MPPLEREIPIVLEKGVSNFVNAVRGKTYTAMFSQVASKVVAKPNMASVPKLRWGISQNRRASEKGDRGRHSL